MRRERNGHGFTAVSVRGSLLPPDYLQTIASLNAPGQGGSDYGLTRSFTVKDEIARYWRIANDLYARYSERLKEGKGDTEKISRKEWTAPLLETVLGYSLQECGAATIDDRILPLTHTACSGGVPVLLTSPGAQPDRAETLFGEGGRKRSPSGLIQELVNGRDKWTWGVLCNGSVLRLHREDPSLTRSSFIEADLELIFQEQLYSDFALLWLLFHVSRIEIKEGKNLCILEEWRTLSHAEGERALDHLRDGVTDALRQMGNGFLRFPGNEKLRKDLAEGTLAVGNYFEELLRLVYRLLFLFSAEERQLLFSPEAGEKTKEKYYEGYSLGKLRDRALRRRSYDRYSDLWQGLKVLFKALEKGAPGLGLTPLGGLFSGEHCPHLDAAEISNEFLLEAIRSLSYFRGSSSLARVNYRDMGTEELGSVYESLLELQPLIDVSVNPWSFGFIGDARDQEGSRGSARKLTGSYYTPSSLVNELIRSTLEPLVAETLKKGDDPRESLLDLKVIDPACGSGHFLLAAARRLAIEVARIESGSDTPDEGARQHAFREVVRSCIYGVDKNPLAVELCRTALWIESLEPGKPLAFLEPQIQCGDSLVGILDPTLMEEGIPDSAYEPLTGDVRAVCTKLKRKNREERTSRVSSLFVGNDPGASVTRVAQRKTDFFEMPEDEISQVEMKKARWRESLASPERLRKKITADIFLGAFFLNKTEETFEKIPTTEDLAAARSGLPVREAVAQAAREAGEKFRFFHWHLAFPQIMERGGFDLVLGNPPWERIKVQEKEFFASRSPYIADAPNAAERTRRIKELKKTDAPRGDRALALAFADALREAEASSQFIRKGGRFPLTGVGDVNTYALFAETMTALAGKGRAGFIVPTGIATDNSTKDFFRYLMEQKRLASLFDFENAAIFPAVHRSFKFCLLTIGHHVEKPSFVFFAHEVADLPDERRRFTLSADDVALMNPNTRTSPIFRSSADAELTKKIYRSVSVLVDESRDEEGNPWGISFMAMFHMSNDSGLFRTFRQLDEAGAIREGVEWLDEDGVVWVPLYEAKMAHQFDSRWATYETDGKTVRDCTDAEKENADYEPLSRYWVPQNEVEQRLRSRGWTREWLMGWRDITNATNERTVISSVIPRVGVGNKYPLIFSSADPRIKLGLIGNLSALVFDFLARQKIGGTTLNYFYLRQFPVLVPKSFQEIDIAFIQNRILELIYTNFALSSFARDLGYSGPPFPWNPDRRAFLRAELDAYYAMLYGLDRNELRYILDPADVKGEGYPSETFRVLKNNEIRDYGEYRTARLVLQAWDRLEEREWEGR